MKKNALVKSIFASILIGSFDFAHAPNGTTIVEILDTKKKEDSTSTSTPPDGNALSGSGITPPKDPNRLIKRGSWVDVDFSFAMTADGTELDIELGSQDAVMVNLPPWFFDEFNLDGVELPEQVEETEFRPKSQGGFTGGRPVSQPRLRPSAVTIRAAEEIEAVDFVPDFTSSNKTSSRTTSSAGEAARPTQMRTAASDVADAEEDETPQHVQINFTTGSSGFISNSVASFRARMIRDLRKVQQKQSTPGSTCEEIVEKFVGYTDLDPAIKTKWAYKLVCDPIDLKILQAACKASKLDPDTFSKSGTEILKAVVSKINYSKWDNNAEIIFHLQNLDKYCGKSHATVSFEDLDILLENVPHNEAYAAIVAYKAYYSLEEQRQKLWWPMMISGFCVASVGLLGMLYLVRKGTDAFTDFRPVALACIKNSTGIGSVISTCITAMSGISASQLVRMPNLAFVNRNTTDALIEIIQGNQLQQIITLLMAIDTTARSTVTTFVCSGKSEAELPPGAVLAGYVPTVQEFKAAEREFALAAREFKAEEVETAKAADIAPIAVPTVSTNALMPLARRHMQEQACTQCTSPAGCTNSCDMISGANTFSQVNTSIYACYNKVLAAVNAGNWQVAASCAANFGSFMSGVETRMKFLPTLQNLTTYLTTMRIAYAAYKLVDNSNTNAYWQRLCQNGGTVGYWNSLDVYASLPRSTKIYGMAQTIMTTYNSMNAAQSFNLTYILSLWDQSLSMMLDLYNISYTHTPTRTQTHYSIPQQAVAQAAKSPSGSASSSASGSHTSGSPSSSISLRLTRTGSPSISRSISNSLSHTSLSQTLSSISRSFSTSLNKSMTLTIKLSPSLTLTLTRSPSFSASSISLSHSQSNSHSVSTHSSSATFSPSNKTTHSGSLSAPHTTSPLRLSPSSTAQATLSQKRIQTKSSTHAHTVSTDLPPTHSSTHLKTASSNLYRTHSDSNSLKNSHSEALSPSNGLAHTTSMASLSDTSAVTHTHANQMTASILLSPSRMHGTHSHTILSFSNTQQRSATKEQALTASNSHSHSVHISKTFPYLETASMTRPYSLLISLAADFDNISSASSKALYTQNLTQLQDFLNSFMLSLISN